MGRYLEVWGAKLRIIRATAGNWGTIIGLDSTTVLRLDALMTSDESGTETQMVRGILDYPYFAAGRAKHNLRLYATAHNSFQRLIDNARDRNPKDAHASQVCVWLHHNFPDKGFDFHVKVINVASRWKSPSQYMSLIFRGLQKAGLTEVLEAIPEATEPVIQALNSLPREQFIYYSDDVDLLMELAERSHVLKEIYA